MFFRHMYGVDANVLEDLYVSLLNLSEIMVITTKYDNERVKEKKTFLQKGFHFFFPSPFWNEISRWCSRDINKLSDDLVVIADEHVDE